MSTASLTGTRGRTSDWATSEHFLFVGSLCRPEVLGEAAKHKLAASLVGDETTDVESARSSMIRVGLDVIRGRLKGGMPSWIEAGMNQAHVPQVSVREPSEKRGRPHVFLRDVRSRAKWVTGHIEGALQIPARELPKRIGEIPKYTPVHIICRSRYRSSIARSVLKGGGVDQVISVVGGVTAWDAQSLAAMAGKS